MHSLHPAARPLGPRSYRAASPSPSPSFALPELSTHTPTPKKNGASARPKLKLPTFDLDSLDGGAFSGGYAGGAQPISPPPNKGESPGEATIMPDQTISPRPLPPNKELSVDDIRKTVERHAGERHNMEHHEEWSDNALEVLGRLGEGASGAVYKVRDKRTGKILARKTITTLEAPMKQLVREITFSSKSDHINIIHFYGAYISPSSSEVHIILEFCEGGSLESVGKRIKELGGRVSEKVAGRLAEGILQGLTYLHQMKTIHRDIKPPNVLLTREGVVKLCDFGVSGELVKSIAGTFTGTSLYMAPERLLNQDYSIQSDVWSTGITLLELVQNRFPFPTDLAAIELMMYITQYEPPELEDEEDISWSPEMKDFIKTTLRRDPVQRPIPRDMLVHPWIVNTMQHDVNMAAWMRHVWGWKKSRKSGDTSNSRPGSSRSELSSLDATMARLSLSNGSEP